MREAIRDAALRQCLDCCLNAALCRAGRMAVSERVWVGCAVDSRTRPANGDHGSQLADTCQPESKPFIGFDTEFVGDKLITAPTYQVATANLSLLIDPLSVSRPISSGRSSPIQA